MDKQSLIDLKVLMDTVVWPLVMIIMSGIVIPYVAKKLKIENNRQAISTVETALTNGIKLAQARFANSNIQRIEVQDEMVATAANYVIKHVPDALKLLGIDLTTEAGRATIAEKLQARIAPMLVVATAVPGNVSVATASMLSSTVATAPATLTDAVTASKAATPPDPGAN